MASWDYSGLYIPSLYHCDHPVTSNWPQLTVSPKQHAVPSPSIIQSQSIIFNVCFNFQKSGGEKNPAFFFNTLF